MAAAGVPLLRSDADSAITSSGAVGCLLGRLVGLSTLSPSLCSVMEDLIVCRDSPYPDVRPT